MKKLNRSTLQRRALIKSLVSAFTTHGKIETTTAKAKMIRPIIEKLARLAKNRAMVSHKQLLGFFQDKHIVNKLFDHVAGSSRSSGFTRLIHTGIRRGDRARLSRLEWVDSDDPAPSPTSPSHKILQNPLKSSKISAHKTHSTHKPSHET